MCTNDHWNKENFPRLFELREQNSSEGFFSAIPQKVNSSQLAFLSFMEIEKDLKTLDDAAWIYVKNEILKTNKKLDKNRGYCQVLSRLYESKGYVYLKHNGYKEIKFITRENGNKTPDLITNGNQKALLEVKTIFQSDRERTYLSENTILLEKRELPKVKRLRNVFPVALQCKLKKGLSSATKQLNVYEKSESFIKIVFFIISLDYEQSIIPDIKRQIEEFLGEIKEKCIKIKCCFIN